MPRWNLWEVRNAPQLSLSFPFQDIVLLKDTRHCTFSSYDLPLGYWMQYASRVCLLFLLQLCYQCGGGFWYSGFCGLLWCSDGCRYCHAGINFLLWGLLLLPRNQVLGTLLSVWLSGKIHIAYVKRGWEGGKRDMLTLSKRSGFTLIRCFPSENEWFHYQGITTS